MQGPRGAPGPQGAGGASGRTGPTGNEGPKGMDGTQVSIRGQVYKTSASSDEILKSLP